MKLTDEQWEQRRYEIAKEVLPVFREADWRWEDEYCAIRAVSLADAIINLSRESPRSSGRGGIAPCSSNPSQG